MGLIGMKSYFLHAGHVLCFFIVQGLDLGLNFDFSKVPALAKDILVVFLERKVNNVLQGIFIQ